MPITVNTNVTSMRAQGNTNRANMMVSQSMQRLSSGLRINSAKDDAAGLAISNRLTSQINGMDVARRNANDGISIAQTAEGAMQTSTNILQRMRDLALQSANGSNSASDRANMQKEIASLQTEMTRIAEKTTFGDINLLDGNFGSRAFQVGANANDTIGISLSDISADAIGIAGVGVDGTHASASQTITGSATSTSLTLGSTATPITIGAPGATGSLDAAGLQAAINDIEGISNVAVTGGALTTTPDTSEVTLSGLTALSAGDTLDLIVGGTTVNLTATNTASIGALETAINGALSTANNTNITLAESGGTITFSAADGSAFSVVANNFSDGASNGLDGGFAISDSTNTDTLTGATQAGNITSNPTTNADTRADFSLDFSNAIMTEGTAALSLDSNAVTLAADPTVIGVDSIDISTDSGAQNALAIIDSALTSIDSQRADLGAIQNRLDHTITNLGNVQNNVADSRSRIIDVDFAKETANMTKQQILLQTSTAMLSQANQIPQIALSLLQ